MVAFSGVEKPRVQVQGDVVFVGYGINAPELKWNDYDGANVRGKWVMIMVNDPPAPADEPTLFGGTGADVLRPLDLQVRRSGAAGRGRRAADSHRRIGHLSVAGRAVVVERHAVFAAAAGRRAGARHQGAGSRTRRRRISRKRGGRDLDAMRAAASKRGFKAVPLNIRAAATLMQRSSRKTAANVIGVLKGTNAVGSA